MLIQRLKSSKTHSAPPPLLAAEISLLTSHRSLHPLLPFAAKLVPLAARYTSTPRGKTNAGVWLARLEAEKAFGDVSVLRKTCKEARASTQGEGIVDVWLWEVRMDDVRDEGSAKECLKTLEVR